MFTRHNLYCILCLPVINVTYKWKLVYKLDMISFCFCQQSVFIDWLCFQRIINLRYYLLPFYFENYLLWYGPRREKTCLRGFRQSEFPWWGRESWLLCLICLPGVSWWLSGSSSRCHGVVCSLWLWYFLIILTYYFSNQFPQLQRLARKLKFLRVARLNMVLSKKRVTKALIRLRGCAGWSAPVLFANPQRQVFSRRGPYQTVL